MKTKLALLSLLFFGAGLMLADEEQENKNAIIEHIASEICHELTRVLAAHRAVEVDDMQRVFDLNAAETRRLKLAARGAAEQYSKAALESIEQGIVRRMPPVPEQYTFRVNEKTVTGPGQEESAPFVTFTVCERPTGFWLETRSGPRNRGGGSYYDLSGDAEGRPGPSNLSKQPLWRKTLDDTLTAEQQMEYSGHRERRLKRAVVSSMVAALSYELLLSDEQDRELELWLAPQLQKLQGEWGVVLNTAIQLNRLPANAPEFLSDTQRELWTKLSADASADQW
ncbi:hypothetical protein [Fuerstiella marisgermanici]|uniref:Uncharacterized protein n=1 Tax=Fuerstiella marisgermanici TaxID=1891926 RepID=A0A1P8WLM7_9PLAN|nr:hypothetical protein [Fuerstiella marisgermanici]APZ94968.1 hypothetical protein Fuma_04620 [Fuerstiella marisgermanici]